MADGWPRKRFRSSDDTSNCACLCVRVRPGSCRLRRTGCRRVEPRWRRAVQRRSGVGRRGGRQWSAEFTRSVGRWRAVRGRRRQRSRRAGNRRRRERRGRSRRRERPVQVPDERAEGRGDDRIDPGRRPDPDVSPPRAERLHGGDGRSARRRLSSALRNRAGRTQLVRIRRPRRQGGLRRRLPRRDRQRLERRPLLHDVAHGRRPGFRARSREHPRGASVHRYEAGLRDRVLERRRDVVLRRVQRGRRVRVRGAGVVRFC